MIGLLHRIFIWFEYQPMPCLCIVGQKARLVIDMLLCSAGPSQWHFYISGVISFCILVIRYEHVDSYLLWIHETSIHRLWTDWRDKKIVAGTVAGKTLNVTERKVPELCFALRPTKRVTLTLHVNKSPLPEICNGQLFSLKKPDMLCLLCLPTLAVLQENDVTVL